MTRRTGLAAVVGLVVLAGCSSESSSDPSAAVTSTPETAETTGTTGAVAPATSDPSPPATTAPAPTSTTPPGTPTPAPGTSPAEGLGVAVDEAALEALVTALAADELAGRDNGTAGSAAARALLIEQLATFAEPVPGADSFEFAFDAGVNVVAVVPGSDLADEYVILGAHYDHLSGVDCNGRSPSDAICNGATDNAAGVAAVVTAARAIAATAPRRSVVVALWDAEEDGLLGSRQYVAEPLVPLDSTVAYLNFDILGSNLLPSLADSTLLIGAETGGAALIGLVDDVVATSPLRVARLSLAFGQGRSDHAPFAGAGVPIAFFGDATNGCYHTVDDDVDAVDFGKLAEQTALATDLAARLVDGEATPEFVSDGPPVAFADGVALLELIRRGVVDIELLRDSGVDLDRMIADLTAVVDAGPDAFAGDAIGIVVDAALGLLEALSSSPCPGR